MDKVLDGVMPMVLGLCLYAFLTDEPITIPVVIVMGIATVVYQAMKLRNSKSRQEKM